jgi:hypothetical protein
MTKAETASETLYFINKNNTMESVQYIECPIYLDHLK